MNATPESVWIIEVAKPIDAHCHAKPICLISKRGNKKLNKTTKNNIISFGTSLWGLNAVAVPAAWSVDASFWIPSRIQKLIAIK